MGLGSSKPYEPVEMAELFKGTKLQKLDGTLVEADDVLKDKVVALYFSAHWCPPCRAFTPILADFHKELIEADEAFEIVFVSFDRSEADLKKYKDECHGEWLNIPFGSEKIQELAKKFDVSGIPALIVLKPDGTLITKNGRSDVQGKQPKACLNGWKS